jgi:hypothetical protein
LSDPKNCGRRAAHRRRRRRGPLDDGRWRTWFAATTTCAAARARRLCCGPRRASCAGWQVVCMAGVSTGAWWWNRGRAVCGPRPPRAAARPTCCGDCDLAGRGVPPYVTLAARGCFVSRTRATLAGAGGKLARKTNPRRVVHDQVTAARGLAARRGLAGTARAAAGRHRDQAPYAVASDRPPPSCLADQGG